MNDYKGTYIKYFIIMSIEWKYNLWNFDDNKSSKTFEVSLSSVWKFFKKNVETFIIFCNIWHVDKYIYWSLMNMPDVTVSYGTSLDFIGYF